MTPKATQKIPTISVKHPVVLLKELPYNFLRIHTVKEPEAIKIKEEIVQAIQLTISILINYSSELVDGVAQARTI